jgi:hypothetical protein
MIWDVNFGLNNGSPTVFKILKLKFKSYDFSKRGGSRCKTGFSDLVDFAINRCTAQRTATTG